MCRGFVEAVQSESEDASEAGCRAGGPWSVEVVGLRAALRNVTKAEVGGGFTPRQKVAADEDRKHDFTDLPIILQNALVQLAREHGECARRKIVPAHKKTQ